MAYKWKPIDPLSDQDKSVDLKHIDSLRETWLEVRTRLEETSRNNLEKFNEQLARLWSIETGILERIYDIDRGTTEMLIEHGFNADLIERSNTTPDPGQLVEVLRDHRAAVELVQDCVANARPLSIGFIHELHSIITRHQVT
ncbi:MAG: Fic family protein, partial [Acidobacteria bacterium]|nr:Fic family protein [Acidobacteriota bacterium]